MIIKKNLSIPDEEIELNPIRAQGSGGQNVNKVSSAVHLRFDIRQSSLSDRHKDMLLSWPDRRISKEGVLIIKAQRFRTLEKNREDAVVRLRELVLKATTRSKSRIPTKPTHASKKRRLEEKIRRSKLKALRRIPED